MCKGTGAFRGPDTCVTATAAVTARQGGVGDGDKQGCEGTEILPCQLGTGEGHDAMSPSPHCHRGTRPGIETSPSGPQSKSNSPKSLFSSFPSHSTAHSKPRPLK